MLLSSRFRFFSAGVSVGVSAAVFGCVALSAPRAAHAAPIVWQAPANIIGESDVSLLGNLVAAYNFGSTANNNGAVSSTTVNGVTFLPFGISSLSTTATVGNFTVSETPGQLFGQTTAFGSASAPFSNLTTAYKTLLQSGVYSANTSTITLTMNNLMVGQTYQYQWWTNQSNANITSGSTTATATNSVTLSSNASGTEGGIGQYTTGTFVADSTTQTVAYNGNGAFGGPLINGFQLRNVSSVGAPEPGTLVLFVFGAAGAAANGGRFLRTRRRANRAANPA